MTGTIVLGTDTDAGKTAFCLLWMALFADRYAYWKPVETGESDSDKMKRLVPGATVYPPLARFREAVAPCLAAQREGAIMPGVEEIIAAAPASAKQLLIETFGSPFSPLREEVLQIELVKRLRSIGVPPLRRDADAQAGRLCYGTRFILLSSSAMGAVGRVLGVMRSLAVDGIQPTVVVLVGPADSFAELQIARHASLPVVGVRMPEGEWTADSILKCAEGQRDTFEEVARSLYAQAGSLCYGEVARRDRQSIWHPYTSLRNADELLVVQSAEEEFVHLADGRTLIDGISSWWTIQHGHRHPPLMAALRRAAEQLDHVIFAGVTHEPAVELAELMLSTMPWKNGRVFYSDNGSTAVEVALKMAYQAWCHRGEPQRKLFVGFENGYHGDTFGAMAAGRDPLFFGRFEPLLFQTLRVPVSAVALDAMLSAHPGEVAAVILEPLVQGAGGMVMHSPSELKAIFDVSREHGVFFIADEVMTGGGRTGTLWAFEQAGIAPDFVCAGKTIAGGILPIAATLIAPQIVADFDTPDRAQTFFHGHSFTAHPLACVVGSANWRQMAAGDWKADVTRIEEFWRKEFADLAGHPAVAELRITGAIAAVEFAAAGGYLSDIGRTLRETAIASGVLLRPLGNVLYAMPPYRISDSSLMRIAAAMRKCVEAVKPIASEPEA